MIGGVTAPRLALAWAFVCGGTALAQQPPVPAAGPTDADVAAAAAPANGVITYPAAFFADFSPTTAFDMVARVPGFTYAAGDAVRGFAGAAGNVLIDGERPSSKSVSLDDALKRIPPSAVERLDLIRGASAGIDMHGQQVVVNVVRKAAASTTFATEGTTRFTDGRAPSIALRVEGSRRTANTTLEGAISHQDQPGTGESGTGIATRHDGAGTLLAGGPLIIRGQARNYQANGAGEYRRPNDTFRVTAGVERHQTGRGETFNLVSAAGVPMVEKGSTGTITDTAELGGDYQRRMSSAFTARLIALYTYTHIEQVNDQFGRGPRQQSDKESTAGEAIVRGTLTVQHPSGVTIEAGGETAFNYLDSANALTNGGTPVVLPSANVRVEERRSEGFLTATHKPGPRLSLEAGVRIEGSTISQTGDVTKESTFVFVKPRFIAAFVPRPSTQIRYRLEKRVSQLKFEDFAATADLAAGFVSAGNADLRPLQGWLNELTFEQRFWDKGAVVVDIIRRDLTDVVDVIPVYGPNGVFSAPGNIGDGSRIDVLTGVTLPLDRLGVAGGQVRFNVTVATSETTDPVTGRRRPISMHHQFEGDFTYTQDLPRLKSTFTLETGPFGMRDRSYRINEIQTLVEMAIVKATWLYRPRPDLVVALAVENLWSKQRDRHRILYSGTRATGIITGYEYRSAQLPPWISLRLRKTF